jgi:hypothetical protein
MLSGSEKFDPTVQRQDLDVERSEVPVGVSYLIRGVVEAFVT